MMGDVQHGQHLHQQQQAPSLPAQVLRNLADKLYDKRKLAALEIESIVRHQAAEGQLGNVSRTISMLVHDFLQSPNPNNRKGGLIGLAAVTVGLAGDAGPMLEQIVPQVLKPFTDPDSRVRYYACEAMYNIAKVTRSEVVVFFNDVFDSLCKLTADSDPNVQSAAHLLDRLVKDIVTMSDQFSVEEFIPLLSERMKVVNPFVQQFLIGWINALNNAPDIDMMAFLPDILDGLFHMLSDSAHEIRVQADGTLREFLQEMKGSTAVDHGRMIDILVQRAQSADEFTRLTAITWMDEVVKIGGTQLFPRYAVILTAVLPCVADREDRIAAVARDVHCQQMNLLTAMPPTSLEVDTVDMPAVIDVLCRAVSSEWESTRLEALTWLSCLLAAFPNKLLPILEDPSSSLMHSLLLALSDDSDQVVLRALDVLGTAALHPQLFHQVLLLLLLHFNLHRQLLQSRASLIIRHLASWLDAEKVLRECAAILQSESDLEFATIMVQVLNLILLTASEFADVRSRLKRSQPLLWSASVTAGDQRTAAAHPVIDAHAPHAGVAAAAPPTDQLTQLANTSGTSTVSDLNQPTTTTSASTSTSSMSTPSSAPPASCSTPSAPSSAPSSSSSSAPSLSDRGLFLALHPAWCHAPVAAFSLCLLSQAYHAAHAILLALDEAHIDLNLLVQADKLVLLLETPIFSFLRFHLLDPRFAPSLHPTLLAFLMLLPQHSLAFRLLHTRLSCVPAPPSPFLHPSSSLPPSSSSFFPSSSSSATRGMQLQRQQQEGEEREASSQTSNIALDTQQQQQQQQQHQQQQHQQQHQQQQQCLDPSVSLSSALLSQFKEVQRRHQEMRSKRGGRGGGGGGMAGSASRVVEAGVVGGGGAGGLTWGSGGQGGGEGASSGDAGPSFAIADASITAGAAAGDGHGNGN